ncbi:MAG: DUF2207 domain-containing protein, partial [Candidatus Binatia bacterium]
MRRRPPSSSRTARARASAVLLFALAILAPRTSSARSIVLERFDAAIQVRADATIGVEETLRLRFSGSWNGIVRSIPVGYRTPRGFDYRLLLDRVHVTDDLGNRLRTEESRRHHREIKIWVPGANDAARTVVLRYRVRNALRFLPGGDELYWNVTGDEWEFPIGSASASILLPAGTSGVRATAFTGAYGSSTRDADVAVDGNEVAIRSRQALGFREGLTAVVGWDKGVVREPGPLARALLFLSGNWPLAVPAATFVVMLGLWWTRGRDPSLRPITVRYEPPGDLAPAEVGTLVDNSPDMRDVTATLVDLAVRGHLEIEEREEPGFLWSNRDYVFRRRDGEAAALRGYERRILDGMFGRSAAPEVRLSDLENRFYGELPSIRDGIFERLLSTRYYDHRPDRVKRSWLYAAVMLAAASIFLNEAISAAIGAAPLTAIVAGVSTAAIIGGFGWFMPVRTLGGARALEEVLGFQEFLARVEADRFERLPRTPATFEKYLP